MYGVLVDKPSNFRGYSDHHTIDCERILVTLLRGLGPWKESVYLVGGLTPRYLVTAQPPVVPEHAGTLDVDIVVDVQILVDTEGYYTLEENLRKMGFERSVNNRGQKLSWRWQTRTEKNAVMVVELLTDAPDIAGGKVEPLPTKGNISALNIPHSSIVFDLHDETEVRAELLGGAGIAVESVKHASIVSFTCLKVLAFDQRFEQKDAYDLVYCIEHNRNSLDSIAQMFRDALNGQHEEVIRECLSILRKRFTQECEVEGYQKDGPVAVARFELGIQNGASERDRQVLRQREVSNIIERLLAGIESAGDSNESVWR